MTSATERKVRVPTSRRLLETIRPMLAEDQGRSPRAGDVGHWMWIFVVIGEVLRLSRYLTDRPLWGDEAMVAVNVLGRGFRELVGPLDFFQVAPVGFLWSVRALTELVGASTWSLRFWPVVCAIASVPLFAWAARRAFGGLPALLSVAIFAVSFPPIRHAAEVKPYAFDLLAALVLLAPAVAWLKQPDRTGAIWFLVAVTPIALLSSHPAVFVAGGLGLALSPAVWRQWGVSRDRGLRRAWVCYLTIVPLSFGLIYALSTRAQSLAVGEGYRLGYWSEQFPPLGEPLRLVGWLLATHAGAAFGYPIGGERGASVLSLLLVMVGVVALSRKGRGGLVAVLLAPLGLTLLASILGRYPYGGSARTMQHVGPALCLLIGAGAAHLIDRSAEPAQRTRRVRWSLGLLGLIGVIILVIDLVRPYRTIEDVRTRDFARWFWPEVARGAEVGCVKAMRGATFEGMYWRLGRLELYLAYRDLEFPKDRDPAQPRLDLVSADHPLRCVLYNADVQSDPELAAWLARLEERFRLREVRRYPINGQVLHAGLVFPEHVAVYEYVPIEPTGGASGEGRASGDSLSRNSTNIRIDGSR